MLPLPSTVTNPQTPTRKGSKQIGKLGKLLMTGGFLSSIGLMGLSISMGGSYNWKVFSDINQPFWGIPRELEPTSAGPTGAAAGKV